MLIKIERTPNPATLKFIVNKKWLEVIWECKNDEDAKKSIIANQLMKVEGVVYLFFGYDFVSVSKEKEANWEILKPIILGEISDFLLEEIPFFQTTQIKDQESKPNPSASAKKEEELTEVEKKIIEVLNEKVQPAIESHGGAIQFYKLENGIVYLDLQGACKGCPSSTITLKNGIENLLKYYFPEITSVESI